MTGCAGGAEADREQGQQFPDRGLRLNPLPKKSGDTITMAPSRRTIGKRHSADVEDGRRTMHKIFVESKDHHAGRFRSVLAHATLPPAAPER